MLSEELIVNAIIDLESDVNPDDEFSGLDEYNQGQLSAYYYVIGRTLTKAEKLKVKQEFKRKGLGT
jgi:hypothetical protein